MQHIRGGIGIHPQHILGGLIHTPMAIDPHLHGDWKVVRPVEQGFEHIGWDGAVAVLVDALVEMLSIVTHGIVGTANIFQVVETHIDFV